ncbi:MAG TPA: lipase maturation factor family protein, partial [Schlesneria sp.]
AFLSFQWDTLLLEMTVCSLLYAPRGWRVDWQQAPPMLPAARWLLWGLAFKLMFLSGVTKLLSGDAAWNDGTALQFHYYTQPIPNWISWYVYQLPLTCHRVALMLMFVVELILPFLIFTGRRGRVFSGLSTIVLMLAIEATGNFGFFNLQTIVLCLPLLNDHVLHRLIRWRSTSVRSIAALNATRPQWRTGIGTTAGIALLALSSLTIVREMVRSQQVDKMPQTVVSALGHANRWLLSWAEPALLNPIAPYRTINGYGLFRVMTTRRPEIVVEISDDGRTWEACEFPYKPGDINRAPPIVAPHMPRLDWLMWFAALNPKGNDYWLAALAEKILEGNPSVARLTGNPKLGRDPPLYVRLTYYEYKFSSADQRNATGAWWSRSYSGQLTGELTRKRD